MTYPRLGSCAAFFLLNVTANVYAEDAIAPRFPNTPMLQATGRASQSLPPDEFILNATIETSGQNSDVAFAALAPKVQKLLENVKQAGIDDDETKATGPDSQAIFRHYYDDRGQELYEKRETIGVRATYTLIIRSKKIEKPGSLVPAIAAAGGNIDNLAFDVSNREDIRRKLELAAVTDASARARQMILAAGAKPGRILEIDPPSDGVADLNRPARHGAVDFSFALRPGMIDLQEIHTVTMEILPE